MKIADENSDATTTWRTMGDYICDQERFWTQLWLLSYSTLCSPTSAASVTDPPHVLCSICSYDLLLSLFCVVSMSPKVLHSGGTPVTFGPLGCVS